VELNNTTLRKIHEAVADKSYSYEQLMRDTLAAIERHNPALNAIVALQDEKALLAEAVMADKVPVSGLLHGIPIAIKDLVNVRGIVSSFGSRLLQDNVPAQDDVIAERIRRAGAIIIGKTNTPEFGLGSQTYNAVYGATGNPHDTSKTCGGSSGGAAASLASGMLVIADGSDMMGSLRNPAAFCNVYGFRPTYGLVPNEPKADTFMHQLSTLGPMAKTIEDLATLLEVIAGADKRHPHSLPSEMSFLESLKSPTVKRQRVAWLADWDGSLPMEPGVLDCCEEGLAVLEQLGHTIEPLTAPFELELMWQSWTTLRSFAIASLLKDAYSNESARQKLKPEAIYEIERGLALTGSELSDASQIRSQWFAKTVKLFSEFDALVLPSSQVFAFDKEIHWPSEIAGKAMSSYHRWMEVVVPASLIGIPALNVPVGFSASGLPMGMQLMGPRHSDLNLLRLGEQYHQATKWPQAPKP